MKATGIVRRIDDLGRVVVPKEIRRTLRIREGDPLEIFTDREGEIILKKYSPIGELSQFAQQYAESLSYTTGTTVCITDRDAVIAAAGAGKKHLEGKNISADLTELMTDREQMIGCKDEKKYVKIVDSDDGDFNYEAVCTIICQGDAIGSVVMLSSKQTGETEKKLTQTAAEFLGRQLEQ